MDAGKILGSLLRNNASSGKMIEDLLKGSGKGGKAAGGMADILGSVLGGGKGEKAGGGASDVLGSVLSSLTKGKAGGGGGGLGGITDILGSLAGGKKPEPEPAPAPTRDSGIADGPFSRSAPPPQPAEDTAMLLIRAMCNAAKVDGNIDRSEQEAILKKLGDVTQDEIEFVQNELSAPLDVDAFCASVPRSLAPQVYGFSVMTIRLDSHNEAAYLGQLAQGLDLDKSTCNQIHQQLGAPTIF